MSLGLFGIFSMRAGVAWRYRLFAIIPGGFGVLMAFVAFVDSYNLPDWLIIAILIGYPVLALIFIPYAVWAIDKSFSFLLGENFLMFEGHIFILIKLAKYFIAGFFLPVLVPIGMLYVRSENLNALGQIEAEELEIQRRQIEMQQAAEQAEIARKQEIREEAMKIAKEMREVEKEQGN